MTSGGKRIEAGRKVKRLYTPFGRVVLRACKVAILSNDADWQSGARVVLQRIDPALWDRLSKIPTSAILIMCELAEAED